MRVVFTGSSRTQLAQVFSNTDAPLYAVGATVHDFPLVVNYPLAKPFSKSTLATLSKALGLVSLEPASVQHSLRGLAVKNVLTKSPRRVYTFESAAFERWVRTLTLWRGVMTRACRTPVPSRGNRRRDRTVDVRWP
jgi:hypothetical protein